MPLNWTIKGEAGKALDATSRTLPELQATGAVVAFRSLGMDTLTWRVALGEVTEGSTIIPELGQRVTLYRDGGRYFTGWVTGRDPVVTATRAEVAITVSGPWWWLSNMALSSVLADQSGETNERTAFVFSTGSVTDHLQGLITRAIAVGAPIRAGSIATCYNIPRLSRRNETFAEAFSQLMRWVPDGIVYLDYTGSDAQWPALCMQRRGAAATVTVDPTAGTVPVIRIKPRLELKLSEVHVAYAVRATVDNKRLTQWALQSAGTPGVTPGRQIFTVSGPELDTFLPQDFTDAVTVRTGAIFTGFTGLSPSMIGFKDERLRAAGGAGFTAGVYTGYNQTSDAFTLPQNGALESVTDADGNALPDGYDYYLKVGEPKEWWAKDGIEWINARVAATIHSSAWVDYPPPNGYEFTPPAWAEAVGAQQTNYVGRASPGGDLRWYAAWTANVSISIVAVKTSWPTDTVLIRQEDYGFINPPSDLAENLLAAQNWLPYEGSIETVVGADEVAAGHQLGAKLDLMAVLPEHESMGAPITGQTVTIRTGQISYELGAPARLAYRDLVNQFRAHGADNIVYLNETNPISPPSGPGAPSTYRTLTEDGQVELDEDGGTTVDENDT